ncbi:hypothetical protein HPB49_000109 [Dermacentor silvarum]|uniref:Uncharacterized protein n=1 Tax=Dermacentor silvarum TaxID=543639 RepID=A0ACB8D9Q8_DERSI|nr:hypothetical protein HPB49_000109 [Dermacentor silvarum]
MLKWRQTDIYDAAYQDSLRNDTITATAKTAVWKQMISRNNKVMPPKSPAGSYKAIFRVRGGFNASRFSHFQLSKLLSTVAGVPATMELRQDVLTINATTNTVTLSTESYDRLTKYLGIKSLTVGGQEHEVTSYSVPNSETCKGIIYIDRVCLGEVIYEKGHSTHASDIYFKKGTDDPLTKGDILKNPDLASTYQKLMEEGVDYFYKGALAEKIVEAVNKSHGILEKDDLANYKVRWVEPVKRKFKDGRTMYSVRPPASGPVLAYILGIVDEIRKAADDTINDDSLNYHRLLYSDAFIREHLWKPPRATKEAHVSTQATESGETPPAVPTAMPLYGRLEPFKGNGSAWPVFEEQVHVSFRANDTPEAKQRDIFLASCGTRVFSLLLDLLKPALPHTRLLELPDPSLDDVVKAAQAMDAAAKDAGEIARATGSPLTEATVNKMTTKGVTCIRCGGDHSPSQCQFSQAQYFTCGKTGHLARVCRGVRTNSGPLQQQPGSSSGSTHARGQGSRRKRSRRGRVAAGAGPSAARLHVVAENPPIFDMWQTGLVPSSVSPYLLTVEVCGHPIFMELDTGASVSVMTGKLFKRTFPDVSVEASGVMLRSYSGQVSQVQGQAQVSVRFGDREATFPFI